LKDGGFTGRSIISPHIFRLSFIWENGIAVRLDVALVWRGVTPNTSEEWSEEEDKLMRLLYPDNPQVEIMQALPRRAWNRILERAQVLKLDAISFPLSISTAPIQ
jgi:hypothetical protein